MDITVEGHVGVIYSPDGDDAETRLSRDGSLVVCKGHADLFEVASRGQLYIATGGVAGVTTGTAFGGTAPAALANPNGNLMALVVSHATIGYVSGTLGLGCYCWGQAAYPAGAPTANFVTTVQTGKLTGSQNKNNSTGLFYTNTSLTATPTILRPSLSFGAFAGAAAMPSFARDDVRGAFVVMPGAVLALQALSSSVAGSPLFIHSIAWYEVPLAMVQ